MRNLSRREFAASALAFGAAAQNLWGAKLAATNEKAISEALRTGIERHKIPCVTATVSTRDKILYQGAFGKRDSASGVAVKNDSLFAIASMTKAITATAAMQLVEQGKLTLEEPVSKHLPELAKIDVIDGFDASGQPTTHTVRTPITLHHLLTHTSGFSYDTWNEDMVKWEKGTGKGIPAGGAAPLVPLTFEPGTHWQYGYSMDWAGKLVETVSGMSLEDYFQKNILRPLGMTDTSFLVPPEKFDRLVSQYGRDNGVLVERPRAQPTKPANFNGGGGLYSTSSDYIKFTQMILRKGRSSYGEPILRPKTVALMSANQTGNLPAGRLKSFKPAISDDVDLHPGAVDRYTFGFLMNPTAYQGGRSAGSLAWAGVFNTFYWIDPKRDLCAVAMMQFLPFVDKEAVALLGEFEHAVYSA